MTRMPETYLDAASTTPLHPRARAALLAAEGIAVHSGSSCAADAQEPSHVLAAMGAITHGSVRVSFLPAAVAELREMADLDSRALDRVTREGR
jgi:cysteine sulfinate desulfinase/cysteine desulfurase-like protein